MISAIKSQLKFTFVDLLGDIIRFPLWWYTKGLKKRAVASLNSVRNASDRWALGIWVKNLFVPMYGEYSWQGRLISFFIRFIQIIFRSILVGMWAIFIFILFLVWAVLPIFIIWQILYHFNIM